jgi:hypothetical protein
MLRSPLSSPLRHPLSSPLAARRGVVAYNPVAVYGADLVTWYGNSLDDLWLAQGSAQTLFQDNFGNIPVTAIGQTVGLILDRSQGLTLGSQLIANGGFDDASGWTLGTGWNISGGVVSFSNPTGTSLSRALSAPMVAGRTYRVTVDVSYTSGSGFILGFNGGGGIDNGPTIAASGQIVFHVRATLPRTGIGITGIGGSVFSLDNISVRELAGNHLHQPSAASRMVLEHDGTAAYLLSDGSNDSYVASSIGLTSTDAVSVISTGRKGSDAAVGRFYEFGPTTASNNGSFGVAAPGTAAATNYVGESRGTSLSSVVASPFAAPHAAVISQLLDVSTDTNRLRINGSEFTSATDQGSGNFGTFDLFVGRRNNASEPFNGRYYSMPMIVRRLMNSEELAAAERAFGRAIGVLQ